MEELLRVFISYKRQDVDFARQLRDQLQSWGYTTWLDVDDIESGIGQGSVGWVKALLLGVKSSQVMIGLLAPESLESEVILGEWQSARDNGLRLLLFRIRDVHPGDVPPPFNTAQYCDAVADKTAGISQLRASLEQLRTGRRDFKANVQRQPAPPIPPTTVSNVPDATAPKPRLRWQSALQTISILIFIASLIWLIFDPGYEPLIGFLGAVAGLLTASALRPQNEREIGERNDPETRLRERIKTGIIETVLYPALREVKELHITRQEHGEAVLHHQEYGPLPLDSDILSLYRALDGYMLILGNPGAGKTILLLQLVEMMLADSSLPIPVVFNLSSWALSRKPLREWVLDEFRRQYRVRRGLAEKWLNNGKIALMLDGLDEVKEEVRAEGLKAINAFRKPRKEGGYDYIKMVVCSRIADYQKLSRKSKHKLNLRGAIQLEPLNEVQVDEFLSDPRLEGLREVVAEDETLSQMTRTPYLLNTMGYAYADMPATALRLSSDYPGEAGRRQHLFETYVQKRLKDSLYDYRQTLSYLEWLATKMLTYTQSVFRLEDVQPYWLEKYLHKKWIYITIFSISLIMGIVFGLLSAIVGGSSELAALILSITCGWLCGLFGLLIYEKNPTKPIVTFGFGFDRNLKRFILRLIVVVYKRLPFFTTRFLNSMVHHNILRRYSDGYMFMHRTMLESFARHDEILLLVSQLEDLDTRDHALKSLVRAGEPAVALLITAMKSSNELKRSGAAIALGGIGDTRAIDTLINSNALRDTNMDIRESAANALCKIGDNRAVDVLISVVKDRNSGVRETAANALVQIGGKHVVDVLISVVKDRNSGVRETAANALVQIGGKHVVDALVGVLKDSNGEVRRHAARALAKLGWQPSEFGEQIIYFLAKQQWNHLVSIGYPAVDGLIGVLQDEYYGVRASAAEALGQIGGDRAVDTLLGVLKDEDSSVRASAAEALRKIGGDRAVDTLLDVLKDEDSSVRASAAEALGQIGGDRAVDTLLGVLKDEDSRVRASAAEALGQIGGDRAVNTLLGVLKDEDSRVRASAAKALRWIGDSRAVDALLGVLKDEDSRVRASAADALGRIGDNRVVDALIGVLRDQNYAVRESAATALGRIGDNRVVDALIGVLRDQNYAVRESAATALGWIGGEQATDALKGLRDQNYAVRESAATALVQIGGEQATDALISALKDEDAIVRMNTAEALGRIGDSRAVDALIGVLQDQNYAVRESAVIALGRIGDSRAVNALLNVLQDRNTNVRLLAVEALESIGTSEALEAVRAWREREKGKAK